MEHYAAISREYSVRAQAFGELAEAAARAEGVAKHEKAKFKVRLRDTGEVRADADAETRAEADDRIAGLLQARLLTAATRDAAAERLRQLRAQIEFGRSVISQEREVDRLEANR